jgi:ankyrin repeat protein
MKSFYDANYTHPITNNELTQFREAAMKNDLDALKNELYNNPALLNAKLTPGKFGELSMFIANNLPYLSAIKYGYNENRDNLDYTALHWAARNGALEMINFLCDKGAEINSLNLIKNTPLHVALAYQQYEAVKLLLEKGANPSLANSGTVLMGLANRKEEFTPLHYAVLYGRINEVELLMSKGAQCLPGAHGIMPLHLAVNAKELDKINYLIKSGHDINCQTESQQTPLYLAMINLLNRESHALEIVNALLDQGGLMNEGDHSQDGVLAFFVNNLPAMDESDIDDLIIVSEHVLNGKEVLIELLEQHARIDIFSKITHRYLSEYAQHKTLTLTPATITNTLTTSPVNQPATPTAIPAPNVVTPITMAPPPAPPLPPASLVTQPYSTLFKKPADAKPQRDNVNTKISAEDELFKALKEKLKQIRVNVTEEEVKQTEENNTEFKSPSPWS